MRLFHKYMMIGIFIAVTGMVMRIILNYYGSVVLGFDIRIVTFIVDMMILSYGFAGKFFLYKYFNILRDEK